MIHAGPDEFSGEEISRLFVKGRKLFTRRLLPCIETSGLKKEECFIVEYGCRAGRILNSVAEQGLPCAGIGISQTMLAHCRRLVPRVESLHLCDPHPGKTDLPDQVTTLVYSYAVLQHMSILSTHQNSIIEMCREKGAGTTCAGDLLGRFITPHSGFRCV
jgi:hypothetical protein